MTNTQAHLLILTKYRKRKILETRNQKMYCGISRTDIQPLVLQTDAGKRETLLEIYIKYVTQWILPPGNKGSSLSCHDAFLQKLKQGGFVTALIVLFLIHL